MNPSNQAKCQPSDLQPQDGQSPASIPLILSPILQTNVSSSPTPTRDFPFKCAGD